MWPQVIFINALTGAVQYISGQCQGYTTTYVGQWTFSSGVLEDGDIILATVMLNGNSPRTVTPADEWKRPTGAGASGIFDDDPLFQIDQGGNTGMLYKVWRDGDPLTFTPFVYSGGTNGGGVCLFVLRGIDPENPVADSIIISTNGYNTGLGDGHTQVERRLVSEQKGNLAVWVTDIIGSSDAAGDDYIAPTVDGVRVLAAGEIPDSYTVPTYRGFYMIHTIDEWNRFTNLLPSSDPDPQNNSGLVLENTVRNTTTSAHYYGGYTVRYQANGATGPYGAKFTVPLVAGKYYSFCGECKTQGSGWGHSFGAKGPSGQDIRGRVNTSGYGGTGPASSVSYWNCQRPVVNATDNGAFTYTNTLTFLCDETGNWDLGFWWGTASDGSGEALGPTLPTGYLTSKSFQLAEVPGLDYCVGPVGWKAEGNTELNDRIGIVPVFRKFDQTVSTADANSCKLVVFNKIGAKPKNYFHPTHARKAWWPVDDNFRWKTDKPTRVLPPEKTPIDLVTTYIPNTRFIGGRHMGNDAYGICWASPQPRSIGLSADGKKKFYFEVDWADCVPFPSASANWNPRVYVTLPYISFFTVVSNPIHHYNSYQGGRPAYEKVTSKSATFGVYDNRYFTSWGTYYDGVQGTTGQSTADPATSWAVGDTIGIAIDFNVTPPQVECFRNGYRQYRLNLGSRDQYGRQFWLWGLAWGSASQNSYMMMNPRINERGPFKHRLPGYVGWDYRNAAAETADYDPPTVRTYTTTGTWTKPAGVQRVEIRCIAGGGGGGGGSNTTTASHGGGAGGSGGGIITHVYGSPESIPASISINAVGTGGTGGNGQRSGAAQQVGNPGGDTTVVDSDGNQFSATGGLGGTAAGTSTSTSPPYAVEGGGRGGGHGNGITQGSTSYMSQPGWAGGGGGGCGGFVYNSALYDGSPGGDGGQFVALGGAAATWTTIPDPTPPAGVYGLPGGDGQADTTLWSGGGGGGGGGGLALTSGPGSGTVQAGPGGNGGFPGGGGGGGGAMNLVASQIAGDGGDGANGVVYILEYYTRAAPPSSIQRTYTSNDTWVDPGGLKGLTVVCIGGGGGGGGGASGNVVQRSGGGGGGAGGFTRKWIHPDDIPASAAITVGTAGTGGVGGDAGNSRTGQAGTAGTGSSFGSLVVVGGGGAGAGGGNTAGQAAGGSGGTGQPNSASGGNGGALQTYYNGEEPPRSYSNPGAGGGGGGQYSTNYGNGGNGGYVSNVPGGAGGATSTINDPTPPGGQFGNNGSDGPAGSSTEPIRSGGGGGGGGLLRINTAPSTGDNSCKAPDGGNGGFPGGGGGGGGAFGFLANQLGGDGGDGSPGMVIVIEHY